MDKKDKIKKSLKYSVLDGTFNAAKIGFGESFFSAFAVFLKAGNIELGLLGSLPQTLGSLSQLFSDSLIKFFRSRKKFVYIGALLEGLMYIPIALVFFFGNFSLPMLIFFICLYWIFGSVIGPAWNSWMGDLVDENKRGDYFGRRGRITGFASFVGLLIGGYLLHNFTDGNRSQYIGFAVIFILALLSRIVSVIYQTKKYEPSYTEMDKKHCSFIEFLKEAGLRNYGLFVFYLCLMNFAVFLASPFFVAYMLYDLKLNYLNFTILTGTAVIFKYVAMPIWGKASDRFGTRKILSLSGFLMPIVPVLWLFSKEVVYLMFVQAYSGFIWAGFEISSFNFIFDTTDHKKRATYVAYFNVLNGVAIFLGAMIGSFIVKHNNLFWSQYYLVFLLSFVFRYIASFVFVPRLKEVRRVEKIPYPMLFFEIVTTMPTMGIVHSLITLKKK